MDGATALLCLALNVYFESRGEPVEGQYAVAMVTLNRAKQSGQDICSTVFAPKQFSWTEQYSSGGVILPEHRPRGSRWLQARLVAANAFSLHANGVDTIHGATHFHADYVAPAWKEQLQKVKQIGTHVFYKEK